MIHLHNNRGGASEVEEEEVLLAMVSHGIGACEEEKITSSRCEWTTDGYLPQPKSLTS